MVVSVLLRGRARLFAPGGIVHGEGLWAEPQAARLKSLDVGRPVL